MIDPSATFAEAMHLATFYKRLQIVAEATGFSWQELKRVVTRHRLPVMVIEESMRVHAHDQPERKGSDLNDVHLLCLAPYADISYVDKRVLENVRRGKAKVAIFGQLVGTVAKAASASAISAGLRA